MLIRRASTLSGRTVDIRSEERIVAMEDFLPPRHGERVLDAAGGLVIPGLHDHHVHLLSAAAALASVSVGPPEITSIEALTSAVRGATPDASGWVRAVGYHDSVAGPLDRHVLDTVSPTNPLRVQQRSGGMWVVNSVGLERLGLAAHSDGCFRRSDGDVFATLPRSRPLLAPLSDRFTSFGVTGVTDATPDQTADDIDALASACRSGEFRQRVHAMAPPDIEPTEGVTLGATKIILEDDDLDVDRLDQWICNCHNGGRPVAIHAVTVSQLVVAIAALRSAGAWTSDRIEHAAMVPDDCIDDMAALAVTVVTQPNFVVERGAQYRDDVVVTDHAQLWRVASLIRGGVKIAFSTDLPYGDGDPWAAMRAAVHRSTATGFVLGENETVSARKALNLFLGHPERPATLRTLAPGQPGDLCVLAAGSDEVLRDLDAAMVLATIVGGQTV